jgi:hypothetical protein
VHIALQTAIIVATGGALLELFTHPYPPLTTCIYFSLWAVLAAARSLWASLCDNTESCSHAMLPPALQHRIAADVWQHLTSLAADAHRVDPPTVAFVSHALSCLPVLVLGFVFLEGAATLLVFVA